MSGELDRADVRFEARLSLLAFVLLVAAFVGTCFAADHEAKWRAQYFANPDLAGDPVVTRWEKAMRFEWGQDSPASGVPPDGFSARFESCLVLADARRVAFLLTSDDGASFELDGERVIDLPGVHPRRSQGVELDVEAGVHRLRVDYFDSAHSALVGLSASLDGRAPQQIPHELLRRPVNGRCPDGG